MQPSSSSAEIRDLVVVLPVILGSTLAREGKLLWASSADAVLRAITSFGSVGGRSGAVAPRSSSPGAELYRLLRHPLISHWQRSRTAGCCNG
jgi:hypothetical protein